MQEEVILMELGGLLNKVTSNGDKLGAVMGAWGTLSVYAKEWVPYGIKDPISAAMNIINSVAVNPHFPNMQHVAQAISNHGIIVPAAQGMVLGYVLKALDLDPKLNRLGGFLEDAGLGAALAALAIEIITYSGAGNSPAYPRGMNGGSQSNGNFWGGS